MNRLGRWLLALLMGIMLVYSSVPASEAVDAKKKGKTRMHYGPAANKRYGTTAKKKPTDSKKKPPAKKKPPTKKKAKTPP